MSMMETTSIFFSQIKRCKCCFNVMQWDKVDDKLAVGGLGFAALILLFASSGLINVSVMHFETFELLFLHGLRWWFDALWVRNSHKVMTLLIVMFPQIVVVEISLQFLGYMLLEHLQQWSVCISAKTFLTSKFSYLLFSNPTHKTKTGTATRSETTNGKLPGPIIMIDQSKTGSSS